MKTIGLAAFTLMLPMASAIAQNVQAPRQPATQPLVDQAQADNISIQCSAFQKVDAQTWRVVRSTKVSFGAGNGRTDVPLDSGFVIALGTNPVNGNDLFGLLGKRCQ